MEIKIRKGQVVRNKFCFPAAYRTLGENKIPKKTDGILLLKPDTEPDYTFTDLFIDVRLEETAA